MHEQYSYFNQALNEEKLHLDVNIMLNFASQPCILS